MEKRAARLGWTAVIAILLASVGLAVLLATLLTGAGGSAVGAAQPLGLRASYDIEILDGGLVYYDGAMLTALDENGALRWTFSAGLSAKFDVGAGGIASWTENSLSFINDQTGVTIFSGTTQSPVLSATVGEKYEAALMGGETTASLYVMDDGREVDVIDLSGEIVLDYGFFYSGSLLWVMTLDTTGSVPMSKITTYKPGIQMLGAVTEIEQIVYRTLFQTSQLRAVGTVYLKTYDHSAKELAQNRTLVYGWYMKAVEEDIADPLMAFVPVSQSSALSLISDVRLIKGGKERTVRMPFPCESLFCQGGTLYGFAGDYLMICREGDSSARAYRMPVSASRVLGVTSARKAVVEFGGEIYLVALQ